MNVPKPDSRCQCQAQVDCLLDMLFASTDCVQCERSMTQEDMLCDICRTGECGCRHEAPEGCNDNGSVELEEPPRRRGSVVVVFPTWG
jgi:hypothetical protein